MSKRYFASGLGLTAAAALLVALAPACSDASSNGPSETTDAATDAPAIVTPTPDSGAAPIDAGADAPSTPADGSVDAAGDASSPDAAPVAFTPSNFVVTGAGAVAVTGIIDAALPASDSCSFDTDAGTLLCSSNSNAFPPVVTQLQPSGAPAAVVFAFKSLSIPADTVVSVEGSKPLVLYVLGAVDIEGTLDTDANGSASNSVGNGGDTLNDATGGAGGSFCGLGGAGGNLMAGGGGHPGNAYGGVTLIPLIGGSIGGNANGTGDPGGSIQITSKTSITVGVGGAIGSNGFGGQTDDVVGGGGGSGGSILLEAPAVTVSGVLAANGGGGGDSADSGNDGTDDATPAGGSGEGGAGASGTLIAGVTGGADGTNYGGGGGGAGRIRINTHGGSATITGVVSPALSTACATQGALAP